MTSFAAAMEAVRAVADAYAEGDEEMLDILIYEIYCDYHVHKEAQE